MNFVEQALAMFDNGVPTLADFRAKVWRPSHSHNLGSDKKPLNAIYHYIDAYNSLKKGKINSAYDELFNGRLNVVDDLPEVLDRAILRKMHAKITREAEARKKTLIDQRNPSLTAAVDKFKEAMSEIKAELEKDDICFFIDTAFDAIVIQDNKTGVTVDIDMDEFES